MILVQIKQKHRPNSLAICISIIFATIGLSTSLSAKANVQSDQTIDRSTGDTVLLEAPAATSGKSRILPGYMFGKSTAVGAGRFGESRANYGNTGHQGVDISIGNTPVVAAANGTVVSSKVIGGGGEMLAMSRDGTDDIYYYFHLKPGTKKPAGTKVKVGDPLGVSGKSGGSFGLHLHAGYLVPKSKQAYRAWVNSKASSGGQNVVLGSSINCCSMYNNNKGYQLTDPGLYFKEEIFIKPSYWPNDPLVPFLGNTTRTQVNALYGANLPTASKIQGFTVKQPTKSFPRLKVIGGTAGSGAGYVDPTVNAQATMSVVQTLADGGFPADIQNASSLTPEQYGMYAMPRTMFGGENGEATIQIGDGNTTVSTNISNLGTSRFNNETWQKQLMGMSMRGMLLEYLNMVNAENFIRSRSYLQKERIESLWAAFTSARIGRYGGSDVQLAYARAEQADPNPQISDMPLDDLVLQLESGAIPYSDALFGNAVYKPSGKGCDAGYVSNFKGQPTSHKMIWVTARKFGFDPNVLAGIVGFETSNFNWKISSPGRGLIQMTEQGLTYGRGKFTVDRAVKAGMNPVIAKKMVTERNLSAETLSQMTPNDYIAVMELYFLEKGFGKRGKRTDLASIYSSVLGGPYGEITHPKFFSQNKNVNWNKTARPFGKYGKVQQVIEIYEAVGTKRMLETQCMYFPDNATDAMYGATPAEVQIRAQ